MAIAFHNLKQGKWLNRTSVQINRTYSRENTALYRTKTKSGVGMNMSFGQTVNFNPAVNKANKIGFGSYSSAAVISYDLYNLALSPFKYGATVVNPGNRYKSSLLSNNRFFNNTDTLNGLIFSSTRGIFIRTKANNSFYGVTFGESTKRATLCGNNLFLPFSTGKPFASGNTIELHQDCFYVNGTRYNTEIREQWLVLCQAKGGQGGAGHDALFDKNKYRGSWGGTGAFGILRINLTHSSYYATIRNESNGELNVYVNGILRYKFTVGNQGAYGSSSRTIGYGGKYYTYNYDESLCKPLLLDHGRPLQTNSESGIRNVNNYNEQYQAASLSLDNDSYLSVPFVGSFVDTGSSRFDSRMGRGGVYTGNEGSDGSFGAGGGPGGMYGWPPFIDYRGGYGGQSYLIIGY